MNSKKTAGILLLALGIIVLVLFLLADTIGLGVSPGFGYRQAIGAVAGATAAVAGLVLMLK